MQSRIFSSLTLAVGLVISSGQVLAATKTVCSNVNLQASGYLITQTDIPMGNCPTKKGTTWSTPKNGLVILMPQQLQGLNPPYAVVKHDAPTGAKGRYTIKEVVDGLVACASPVLRPYGFFTKGYGKIGGCPATGPDVNNAITYYQHMWVELAKPAGKPGELRVKLNTKYTGQARYYAITTTSSLHGGKTTLVKTPLKTTKTYTLKELGSDFVSQAKQGATFSFKVEAFEGGVSVAKYTVAATGQEMIKN